MKRKTKRPNLYKKSQDGAYYFNYEGKQKYAGKTLEKAEAKLREITGLAPSGDTDLVALIGQYLDSLVGTQSPDTIYGKAGCYKRMLAWMSGQKINGNGGPGLYSLHDSSKAKAKHRSYVEALSSMLVEPIPLLELTTESLEKYQRSLLRRTKKSTVRTAFIKIKALAKWLHEKRYLSENPCANMKLIKVPEELDPDHLTEEEVDRLFELVETRAPFARDRDKMMFGLMIYGGLRRIECTRVLWSDVDLERRMLIVRNGKGEKPRLIPIHDKLHEILSSAVRIGDHLLTSREGNPLKRAALTKVAERYLNRLDHEYQGRKRFSLHALRATFATRLCEKGVSTRIVQSLLGHSDPRTTLRYAAVSEAAAMDAVNRL